MAAAKGMSNLAREVALRVVRTLREGGHTAFFAGGCVRDELLGLTPKDYDVATDATPTRVAALFRRTREVGKSFGVVLVRESGVTVEVTTFRREGTYSDRRRPDAVEFAGPREDAARRDFTINALYIDPVEDVGAAASGAAHDETASARRRVTGVRGEVIDFVGGLGDLEARVIRAVGDADARLSEDDLRALRAARFAARLGFVIEEATALAIRRHAGALVGVSRERIGDELRLMLRAGSRASAARVLEELGLDGPALMEAARGGGKPLRTLAAMGTEAMDGAEGFGLAAAAWMLDRWGTGDEVTPTGVVARERGAAVTRWRRALCLSNDETQALAGLLEMVVVIESGWSGLGVARKKRAASSGWFEGAMRLTRARGSSAADEVSREVAELAGTFGGLAPKAWVSGDALVAAGARPGPGFGKWLDDVYDAQLEGRVSSAAEAMAMARRLAGL